MTLTVNSDLLSKNNFGFNFKTQQEAIAHCRKENFEVKLYKVQAKFDTSVDAFKALLNTNLFYKAIDNGKICCKKPYCYGYIDNGNCFVSFVISPNFEEDDFDVITRCFNDNNAYELDLIEPPLKL